MREKHVTTSDWEFWLAKWNRELLDRIDPALDKYSPLFRVGGFLYASSICGKLKDGKDPLSSYLVSQFGSATRQLLELYTPPYPPDSELTTDWVMDASGKYVPPNQPDPILLKAMVDELDRLIQGP